MDSNYYTISKGAYLETLLRRSQTIFSTEDAALLWSESRREIINSRLNKYVAGGKLLRVHRGLYAKDEQYSRFELATRIYRPSYVSFETVLSQAGITFQYYGSIFVASYVSRELRIGEQNIIYVHIKDYVLSDNSGIDYQNGFAAASPERAFLDRLYVSKDYHFDNLSGLDWRRVFEILPIYHNNRLSKSVRLYYREYQKMAAT